MFSFSTEIGEHVILINNHECQKPQSYPWKCTKNNSYSESLHFDPFEEPITPVLQLERTDGELLNDGLHLQVRNLSIDTSKYSVRVHILDSDRRIITPIVTMVRERQFRIPVNQIILFLFHAYAV